MSTNIYIHHLRKTESQEMVGRKKVCFRDWLIAKLTELEPKTTKTICLEITVSKVKWCVVFICQPPKQREEFFSEIFVSLNKIMNTSENALIARYLNTDFLNKSKSQTNHLPDWKDTININTYDSGMGSLNDMLIVVVTIVNTFLKAFKA